MEQLHSLKRGSAAACLLGLWARIPPGAWLTVCCECYVLGLCDGLITRSDESYRVWCVVVCDREASIMRRPWSTRGCCAMGWKPFLHRTVRNKAIPSADLVYLITIKVQSIRKTPEICQSSKNRR
jgi:hypothetical protein